MKLLGEFETQETNRIYELEFKRVWKSVEKLKDSKSKELIRKTPLKLGNLQ